LNRSLFYTWNFFKKNSFNTSSIVNFGPQHPAAHGVLRLVLQLSGELIERTDIHIGLLHRGTEHLITKKHYEKSIPYFDRLDYVSMMTQEHTYCLTIEKLLSISNKNIFISYIRILFDEITRILNHFLAIACHALDVGSMSSIFWGFEEREKLMEFYERVSGARMHSAFHKPLLSFNQTLDFNLLNDLLFFVRNCYVTLNEMHNVLTYNKIWKQRLLNIGVLNLTDCLRYGLSGILGRSVGLKRDLRLSKLETYSSYNTILFRSFIGVNGDTYDRYLIRMLEMGESLSIINIIVNKLISINLNTLNGSNTLLINKVSKNTFLESTYTSMEDLINHFIHSMNGYTINSSIASTYIESPKGEFGVSLISDNSNLPRRCKIRSPSYHNLQALPKLSKGHYLADLAALIGTIDIVFGEIDR